MIKCNIEVNYFTENTQTGEDDFSHSTIEHVIMFPVLPQVGEIINIRGEGFINIQYQVICIEYNAYINDSHYNDNYSKAEVHINVKEI